MCSVLCILYLFLFTSFFVFFLGSVLRILHKQSHILKNTNILRTLGANNALKYAPPFSTSHAALTEHAGKFYLEDNVYEKDVFNIFLIILHHNCSFLLFKFVFTLIYCLLKSVF